MGTDWSLHAVAPPAGTREGVQAALDRVVAQMSQWESKSDLARFNRAPPGEWQAIPAEFAEVLAAGVDIGHRSAGAFSLTLGELSEAWGFGAAGPVDAIPETAAPQSGLEFEPAVRRIRRGDGALLDLSGIAKGYGVDLAAEWLLANGVRHFLLEVGGELRGEGIRPDGQPWWVDVEVPPSWPGAGWRVALHDLSAATSGDYRRGLDIDGQHYSHSFDPRTGRPIVNGVRSVTVLHRSCTMADGWATALTVLGAEAGVALADEQELAACILANGREHVSRAWAAMLD
ncbi:thiamine biosynthesis protein ApbE [Sphingopyxis sp. QXT-31]|uniref:FAD:protein FMN transferase n=1 Tax=Sphingopyxis sp. QXT-31 TaxID=1357916 RepID=UPI00097924E9|nr:FAD:protein FMN transferase [Sphingopyxis sp. QXT-31]APZ97888.1 thiamine biosynthesis protein ApbE [Sphingopyxis sp. QXT-31]